MHALRSAFLPPILSLVLTACGTSDSGSTDATGTGGSSGTTGTGGGSFGRSGGVVVGTSGGSAGSPGGAAGSGGSRGGSGGAGGSSGLSGSGGSAGTGGGSIGMSCQQAATKLTSCGLSTGGIESNCGARNACYAACMLAATCAELQGPTTAANQYTTCLSAC